MSRGRGATWVGVPPNDRCTGAEAVPEDGSSVPDAVRLGGPVSRRIAAPAVGGWSVAARVEDRLALGEPGLGDCGKDGRLLEREVVACVADGGVHAVVIRAKGAEEAGEADDAVSMSGEEADRGIAGRRCRLIGEGEAVCS